MPVAGTAVAVGGAILGGIGNSKAQRKANRYKQQAAGMLSPEAIKGTIQSYNPQLYDAAYGENPFTAFQKPTDNFADWTDQQASMSNAYNADPMAALFHAPGYIDPRIMNFSLNQINAGAANSVEAGVTKMGRSAFMGGMADAFAMATQAQATRSRAGVAQNYDIDRANRTRSDIAQGQGMLNQAYNSAAGTQGQAAGFIADQKPPSNWAQIGSQAVSAGLGAYGSMQGLSLPGGGGGAPSQASYGNLFPGASAGAYPTNYNAAAVTPYGQSQSPPPGSSGNFGSSPVPAPYQQHNPYKEYNPGGF